jgi:acyl dehydratase
MNRVADAVAPDWRFDRIRDQIPGVHFADVETGCVYEIEGRDTVTAAPELVRLSLNMAETHVDAGSNAHGRRLVYGGHTISIAAAQLTRALPNVVTIVAWRECNHTGPVFEGDILSTVLTVEAKYPLHPVDAGLLDLRAVVAADRGLAEGPQTVLDWRLVAVMA